MKKYDNYKDSGIEWIGEIPEHWEVCRFKYSYKFVNERSELDLPKIGLEHIESWTGRFKENKTEFEGDGISFQEQDILFGKLRPYLAKVYLAEFAGKAVGDFFVFRPESNIQPEYGYRFLLSRNFIEITNSSTFGSKMPRVSPEFISDLDTIIPSPEEQTAIANYLDRKTAEIDELIADKKRLLELYEEEKTAIINQAVTKGINPNVPMKDSGIEWLGEIPEHWEVIRLKHTVLKVGSGVTPRGGAEVYQKEGIPLLRSQNIYSDGIRLDDVAYITEEIHDSMKNSKVFPEDVLLNITGGSIGRTFYVEKWLGEANVNQHVCIIRPDESINSRFLYFILRSKIGQEQILYEQTGSGREGLNFEALKNFYVPFVSLREQQSIVQYIENETTRINQKVANTKKLIDLLTEYRTALISEVVTGKIKVTE